MKTQALVALHDFNYAGRRIRIGETFNAGNRDASVLVAIKRAQPDPAGPVSSMPAPEERTVRAVLEEALIPAALKRRRGRPRKASA